MPTPDPKPPEHLSREARAFWRSVVAEYALEPATLRLLRHACESLDAAEHHRAVVEKEGAVIADRFQQQREHPSCKSQRDYQAAFRNAVKALGLLDVEPESAGRPPAAVRMRGTK
jgi:P27 family predicted phage terminase small subunit